MNSYLHEWLLKLGQILLIFFIQNYRFKANKLEDVKENNIQQEIKSFLY